MHTNVVCNEIFLIDKDLKYRFQLWWKKQPEMNIKILIEIESFAAVAAQLKIFFDWFRSSRYPSPKLPSFGLLKTNHDTFLDHTGGKVETDIRCILSWFLNSENQFWQNKPKKAWMGLTRITYSPAEDKRLDYIASPVLLSNCVWSICKLRGSLNKLYICTTFQVNGPVYKFWHDIMRQIFDVISGAR